MIPRDIYGGRDINGALKPLDWRIEPENLTLFEKGDEENETPDK